MVTRQAIVEMREEIIRIAARYGAHDVRIFGSVARGDATEDSDLDLIVRFDEGRSLLDHGGVVMDLRDLLGVKVDVMDEDGIRERFRKEAMKEAVAL